MSNLEGLIDLCWDINMAGQAEGVFSVIFIIFQALSWTKLWV